MSSFLVAMFQPSFGRKLSKSSAYFSAIKPPSFAVMGAFADLHVGGIQEPNIGPLVCREECKLMFRFVLIDICFFHWHSLNLEVTSRDTDDNTTQLHSTICYSSNIKHEEVSLVSHLSSGFCV